MSSLSTESQPSPVFLVIGEPQNGKSEVRKTISGLTSLKGASCSDVIYEKLAEHEGTTVESLKIQPKESVRPRLIALGDWLCGKGGPEAAHAYPRLASFRRHPSALVMTLFESGHRIIDGIRRREELGAAIEMIASAGHQPAVLFVDRPGINRVPDNTEHLRDMADVTIVNNGSKLDLGNKVAAYLNASFARPSELYLTANPGTPASRVSGRPPLVAPDSMPFGGFQHAV